MDTRTDLSVDKLFSGDLQYKIPRYQRRYVWDETNWRVLWEDILSQLGLELHKDKIEVKQPEKLNSPSVLRSENKHFTGIIVTQTIEEDDLERHVVIDGQQRLTTLQIILCVIRDICKFKGYALTDEIDGLIANKSTVSQRFPDASYKFISTEYDEKEFTAIVKGDYGELKFAALESDDTTYIRSEVFASKHLSVNVVNAYDYFYEWIRIYTAEEYDYHKLDSLIRIIKNRFHVVQIMLDPSDPSEKIFESINATGRMLSEFDYLRNNLFLRARQLDTPKDIVDIFYDGQLDTPKDIVDVFYDKYWHFENSYSYWTADRLETFLRTFLLAKLGPNCFQSDKKDGKNKKAFEVYQHEYYKENLRRKEDVRGKNRFSKHKVSEYEIEYEFFELADYAKDYRESDPDLKSEDVLPEIAIQIREHRQFYKDLENESLLPFILHLKNEAEISDGDLKLVCDILESYIVRRMLQFGYGRSDQDERGYDEIYSLFSQLIESRNFDVEQFVKSLSGRWPNDTVVLGIGETNTKGALHRIARETRESKDDSTVDRAWFQLRYIFHRIEKSITTENRLSFKNFLSYEPTRIQPESQNPTEQESNDWVSIGNLTFREKGEINSNDVNDFGFEETKQILLQSSNVHLRLNQEICESIDWGRRQIRDRLRKLNVYFQKIWPDQKSFLKKISR